eukprot:CAMPEP_0198118154 /NCGR_PEP_ID=MMETSP1442-20131203/20546_1 /TAXON_ID= /ORGANISM="Craspedostauros australis, Strain CCMP3328" /LENGTH=202 /DNA_ID=CAMNT_0043776365 /DNA_START=78 /DNA_END=682 /DNA_ORIENTATION=+
MSINIKSSQDQPTPEEVELTKMLAQDRPTIEAAVKSFISLSCAKSLTTATPATPQQQILATGRRILKAVNAHTFPIHYTVDVIRPAKHSDAQQHRLKERQIVSQLWNALVESQQKPSKFLGRRSLRHAWKLLEAGEEEDEAWNEFGRLLFLDMEDEDVDNDAELIWAADGGDSELAKRRQRRKARATDNNTAGEEETQIVPA